jgi:hypothetical protein
MTNADFFSTSAQVIPTLLVAIAFELRGRRLFRETEIQTKALSAFIAIMILGGELVALGQLSGDSFMPSPELAKSLVFSAIGLELGIVGYVLMVGLSEDDSRRRRRRRGG